MSPRRASCRLGHAPAPTSPCRRLRRGRRCGLDPRPRCFHWTGKGGRRTVQGGGRGRSVTETAVQLLKARGEPASLDQLLGDLLIGLDESGQLARLARVLRPAGANDGWAAWVEAYEVGLGHSLCGRRGRIGHRGQCRGRSHCRGHCQRGTATEPRGSVARDHPRRNGPAQQPPHSPGRAGLYCWAPKRTEAGRSTADRQSGVAVFSLLSSAGHLTERAAIERTAAMFKSTTPRTGR